MLSASELMSGAGVPARIATATPECARATSLPATNLPAAPSLPIASDASTAMSNGSPCWTRLVASTPPTDSTRTLSRVRCCQASASSPSTWRVAIDEMMLIVVMLMALFSWGDGFGWLTNAAPTCESARSAPVRRPTGLRPGRQSDLALPAFHRQRENAQMSGGEFIA